MSCVDRTFLPDGHAILIPRTADGRVLFAVPWLGKTLSAPPIPRATTWQWSPSRFREEIDFILGEAGRYLAKPPTRADIRSVWVGLRPLVKPPDEDADDTKALSREHAVLVERSGLVTARGRLRPVRDRSSHSPPVTSERDFRQLAAGYCRVPA